MSGGAGEARLQSWAAAQRSLARTLGLSIEEWLGELDSAGERKTGLTAAVVGAAMAAGLGLGVLDRLNGSALAARARSLIDPLPPQVESPVLAEAIRRADELDLAAGKGRRLLRGAGGEARTRELPSASQATSDAPGDPEDAE
ncbi:MAG: hypothetical protein IT384_32865 [Deltaproteobacteria bacterium]|nr:hypothetical protein [Deltaproteobacteria bacterium]